MIDFRGAAKRIENVDLPRIAALIGVGEDELHAIISVEASGSGFDAQGRPKALYEPHIAYRLTAGATREAFVAADLAYASWGATPYPKDSYPRIARAMAINETVALKATSWGLGQILGVNHLSAGYSTVQDMVRDFTRDEDNHLEAMVRFIIAENLDDEIRAHNWAGFARGYNGPQYAKHGYDRKLAAAFAWWRTKPDTPWNPDADPVSCETPAAPVILAPSPRRPAPGSVVPPPPDVEPVPPPAPGRPGWWERLFGPSTERSAIDREQAGR